MRKAKRIFTAKMLAEQFEASESWVRDKAEKAGITEEMYCRADIQKIRVAAWGRNRQGRKDRL